MDEAEAEKVVEIIQAGGPNNDNRNGSSAKTVAAIVGSVIALLSYGYSQIEPLRQQLQAERSSRQRLELRYQRAIDGLDKKLQTDIFSVERKIEEQIRTVRTAADLETERTQARLTKIDEWMAYWHEVYPEVNARQTARIQGIERDLYGTPVLIPKRAGGSPSNGQVP
jgi:hypothetical protein|tara:strand:- start:135 stop:638 length:504 start_codon:yes stop_codon:yes gene_type:complete